MKTLMMAAASLRKVIEHGNLGYIGLVAAGSLITGNQLATLIGLSAGVGFNSDEPWMKFAINNKLIHVAKKPLRHSLSWSSLDAIDAVDGSRQVTIGGKVYRIRLPTGGNSDPSSGAGGEWNELMYNVHQSHPGGVDWADFSDADLGINGYSPGSFNWCQEHKVSQPSARVIRGGNSITFYNNSADVASDTYDFYGWRPVLELVD